MENESQIFLNTPRLILRLPNEADSFQFQAFDERNKKHFEDIGNPLWKNKPTERDFLKTIRVVIGRNTKILLGNKPAKQTILKTLDLTRAEFQVSFDIKNICIHKQNHTKNLIVRPVYEAKYLTILLAD